MLRVYSLQTPPAITDTASRGPSDASNPPTLKRQRRSFGYDSPEVVTIGEWAAFSSAMVVRSSICHDADQIRPDWEQKLAAVQAAVARRANRRIIMRQVGDRLIPVGVTSGRVHALSPEEAQAEGIEPSGERITGRRSRRRQQNQEINNLLGSMGIAGQQDLEEVGCFIFLRGFRLLTYLMCLCFVVSI